MAISVMHEGDARWHQLAYAKGLAKTIKHLQRLKIAQRTCGIASDINGWLAESGFAILVSRCTITTSDIPN